MFRRHTITSAGFVFLGITAFVMVAALNSGSNLLYLAFGIMLGGFVASAILSRTSIGGIEARRVMSDHVIAGEPATIQYVITNRKRFWPCFAVHVSEESIEGEMGIPPRGFSLHIAPGKSVTVIGRLMANRRGLINLTNICITCAFPFGFVAHSVCLEASEPLVVYPRVGTLNRHLALRCREATETGTMTSSVRRGNDEFYGLREYRAGDNIRSIHWRSTARTGQLTIREMASNAPPQMIVVLDLRGWRENPRAQRGEPEGDIERAIELAAALVCYAFLENFAVALSIAGVDVETPPIPQMGRESRASILYRLAILDPEKIDDTKGIAIPNRLAGRAEWVVISLGGESPARNLLPGNARFTPLAMTSPEAETWVHFQTGQQTHRLLREEADVVSGAAGR